jgi:hypothetical protein
MRSSFDSGSVGRKESVKANQALPAVVAEFEKRITDLSAEND